MRPPSPPTTRARGLLFCAVAAMGACGGSEPPPEADDPAPAFEAVPERPGVEIEYVAHAAFLIRSENGDETGTELLIDPYASRVWLGYDWPEGIEPDAILVTHPHYDHDAGRFRRMPFPWPPEIPVVDGPGTRLFGAFAVTGVRGRHADPYGMEFGQLNTMMVIEAHGLRIAHLGDNGPLTPQMVERLGRVDVLMIPGDGLDHILSEDTTREILAALEPRIVIPMHYRLPDLEADDSSPSDLGELEPWLDGRTGVQRADRHTVTVRADQLPAERTFLVLEHAPYVTGPEGP